MEGVGALGEGGAGEDGGEAGARGGEGGGGADMAFSFPFKLDVLVAPCPLDFRRPLLAGFSSVLSLRMLCDPDGRCWRDVGRWAGVLRELRFTAEVCCVADISSSVRICITEIYGTPFSTLSLKPSTSSSQELMMDEIKG